MRETGFDSRSRISRIKKGGKAMPAKNSRQRKGCMKRYSNWVDDIYNLPEMDTIEQVNKVLMRCKIPWACLVPYRDKVVAVCYNYEDLLAKIEFDDINRAKVAFESIGFELRPPAKGDYCILGLFFDPEKWWW